MASQCEFHPFEQAVDVCGACYGDICESCVTTVRSRRDTICQDCALTLAGVRGSTKITARGDKSTAKARLAALAPEGSAEPSTEAETADDDTEWLREETGGLRAKLSSLAAGFLPGSGSRQSDDEPSRQSTSQPGRSTKTSPKAGFAESSAVHQLDQIRQDPSLPDPIRSNPSAAIPDALKPTTQPPEAAPEPAIPAALNPTAQHPEPSNPDPFPTDSFPTDSFPTDSFPTDQDGAPEPADPFAQPGQAAPLDHHSPAPEPQHQAAESTAPGEPWPSMPDEIAPIPDPVPVQAEPEIQAAGTQPAPDQGRRSTDQAHDPDHNEHDRQEVTTPDFSQDPFASR